MKIKRNISEKSVFYALLKYYVHICFHWFYRVSYENKEGTPHKGKLIFAPNHQNALMDALAVLMSFQWQPVFLARSDIFANPTAIRILSFLKILPVFRIRDGYDQLANNQDVFDEIFRVLDNDTPITILPEGNHDDRKLLRPLKKGIARMAFSYRHKVSAKEEIHIVPVGLNYQHHHKPATGLHIRFGTPIPISRFDEEFEENPAKGYKAFIRELENQLRENILHISAAEHYQTISNLADMVKAFETGKRASDNRVFQKQKKLIENVEEIASGQAENMVQIEEKVAGFVKKLNDQNLSIYQLNQWKWISTRSFNISKMIVLSMIAPLYLWTVIQNIIPKTIVAHILKLFKDPQFISTANFAATIFVYPIMHLLQVVLVGLVFQSSSLGLIYAATLLPGFAFEFYFKSYWDALQTRNKLIIIKKDVEEMRQLTLEMSK